MIIQRMKCSLATNSFQCYKVSAAPAPNGGKIFLLPKSQWREIQLTKYQINDSEDLSAQIRDVASLIMPFRQEGPVARFTFDKWRTPVTFPPE
ncbi:hypothetical protein CDAR_232331 [Caerostris darwini]|uniref:Uncharacterized protein n=1 Tax=Caerostris darwini TaxID=1538125 RepID=A0AAV4W5Q7_9ARAC|nr:hypothetical protein CDAR_232331 [Caerostris darwini]